MLKKTKEKDWKGVGKSLKQHKKIMDKYWDKTKQKQKVIKKETKPKQKPNMSWWEEHCKWLDTFRGKIISK